MTTDNIIDQAFAEAPEPVATEQPINETAEAPAETNEAETEEDTPWPKKAVNAMSRRDKQIGKLRAQHNQAMQEIETLRKQMEASLPKQVNNGPTEDQFDNFAEYTRALAKHEALNTVNQEFTNQREQQQKQQVSQKEQAYIQERETYVAEKANELIQANPEYGQLLQENIDILESYPAHIERAFLEADNAAAAFVVLAKEGRLEDLANMSPFQAAAVIAKAEDRYVANTKKVTKAPAPMTAVKGNGGTTEKSLEKMNDKEFRDFFKS